jgi:hypothetical protein
MEGAAVPHALFILNCLASAVALLHYGIAGLGVGETPQTAVAQGGRGGVEIRNSLPWVAAEPPLMQIPVKVSRLG